MGVRHSSLNEFALARIQEVAALLQAVDTEGCTWRTSGAVRDALLDQVIDQTTAVDAMRQAFSFRT
jgi:hypothetical protein